MLGPTNPGVTWTALGGGDAGQLWRTRTREGGGRRAGGRRRRSLSTAERAEAPSPRHPRKRRWEMPTSGKPAAECGGSDTEWKAKWRRRRWPSVKGRGRSPRPSRRAAVACGSPPASLPALTHWDTWGPWEGLRPLWRSSSSPWPLSRSPALPCRYVLGWRNEWGALTLSEPQLAGRWPPGPTPIPAGGAPGAVADGRVSSARYGPDWDGCMDLT